MPWGSGGMSTSAILTPLQTALLDEFFSLHIGQSFFLTGGTALAAYYLHHRLSKDIDLFTTNDEAFSQVGDSMEFVAKRLNCNLIRRASSPWFQQFFMEQNEKRLQVDVVRDADLQFGQPQYFDKVIVDSELNIGANKITAIFGRTESKDFVDLYFLLQKGYEFQELLELAQQKDRGMTLFFLGGMMRQVLTLRDLPHMLKPIDLETLQAFYTALARTLIEKSRPEQ